MRDFRDSKAMAHTLRAALAAKGLKITNSQSLELIAEAFGAADWNTLAAAIRDAATAPRKTAAPPALPVQSDPALQFSAECAATVHRALAYANDRKHQYATLEHLLLALLDDTDASAMVRISGADLDAIRARLTDYLDNGLKRLVIDGGNARPTAAFQRVVQRAGRQVQELGRPMVTGANALVAIFAETESPAAKLLGEQGMTFPNVTNFIVDSTGKGTPDASR